MMKKQILFIAALLLAAIANANPTGLVIPLTPIFNPSDGHGGHPRSPELVPLLYLDGYTLTASDNTVGSTIQLLDEDDNVVFSTYVYIEGDIALPATLEGTYTILVIRGDETFEGEIEL